MSTYAPDRTPHNLPHAYDEKDDLNALRQKLANKKKPIMLGLALLVVAIVGISVISTAGSSSEVSNKSSEGPSQVPQEQVEQPSHTDVVATVTAGSFAESLEGSSSAVEDSNSTVTITGTSDIGSAAEESSVQQQQQQQQQATTEVPTTDEPLLPYTSTFDWKDSSNWQNSDGSPVPAGMFGSNGITLSGANCHQPIYTKQGWTGKKIVYIEWTNNEQSDTNIWMLNTGLRGGQFVVNNGWPRLGELDIFEMFNQDAPGTIGQLGGTTAYGQMTFHHGPEKGKGEPCYCPSSHTVKAWYQNQQPMTSSCTAQFVNTRKNSMAAIFGEDGNGQFIQQIQNPTITKGGKKNGVQTYDVTGGGATTAKVYNNAKLFWGAPISDPCAAPGGHNAATGFPFMSDPFRIILEEQKKDPSASFTVTDVKVFT